MKELTAEEAALNANGNRPLTQSTKVRHPDTGQMLDDVGPWQDAQGNWKKTQFNEQTQQHEVAPDTNESEG